jgi:hypothetical protein
MLAFFFGSAPLRARGFCITVRWVPRLKRASRKDSSSSGVRSVRLPGCPAETNCERNVLNTRDGE